MLYVKEDAVVSIEPKQKWGMTGYLVVVPRAEVHERNQKKSQSLDSYVLGSRGLRAPCPHTQSLTPSVVPGGGILKVARRIIALLQIGFG